MHEQQHARGDPGSVVGPRLVHGTGRRDSDVAGRDRAGDRSGEGCLTGSGDPVSLYHLEIRKLSSGTTTALRAVPASQDSGLPSPISHLSWSSDNVHLAVSIAAVQDNEGWDVNLAAFENADAAALGRLLTRDATLEATPVRTWFAGRETCVPFLRDRLLGSPGDWRMLATSANGQPAAATWFRDQDGSYQPYGICVLIVTGAGIRRISSFGDQGLVAVFGFRPDLQSR